MVGKGVTVGKGVAVGSGVAVAVGCGVIGVMVGVGCGGGGVKVGGTSGVAVGVDVNPAISARIGVDGRTNVRARAPSNTETSRMRGTWVFRMSGTSM